MSHDADIVVVSTTVESETEAAALAGRLVEARLAACVQYMPVRSTYRWKGRVERAGEFLVAAKTRASLAPRVKDFVAQHHSYEVPEILVTPVCGASDAYARWLADQTEP